MVTSEIVLGIVTDIGAHEGDDRTYEIIHNGQVYDECRRLDTALSVMRKLLEKRIEAESFKPRG